MKKLIGLIHVFLISASVLFAQSSNVKDKKALQANTANSKQETKDSKLNKTKTPSKDNQMQSTTAAPANTVKPVKQTTSPTPAAAQVKQAQPQVQGEKMKKDGTPDKRYKENKNLKKDGTPDKRFKENQKK